LGEAVVCKIGWQVGGDERDVESADEESRVEQEIARMLAGSVKDLREVFLY
jgi:hypothetical protein